MNTFAFATKKAIQAYRESELCSLLCGKKPFGSRHWEYPWAIEQGGILEVKGLRILDVAPDFTFPYPHFLERSGHEVTYIDLERRQWSDKIAWGADPESLAGNFHIMDVREMSFPDQSFDRIFCISVLEHIVCATQDPDNPNLEDLFDPLGARPALVEMRRCLKPGGRLVLTVDIYGGPRWGGLFSKWDIFSDLEAAGFSLSVRNTFDREKLFSAPETFISQFYGPYITLGFTLERGGPQ